MNKKTVAKTGAVGGVGAIIVSIALVLFNLGAVSDVQGTYTLKDTTSQSIEFIAEDVEDVPSATFYALVLKNKDGEFIMGKANYGTDKGVVTAKIVSKPISNLYLIVYDHNLEEIGVGECKNNGVIEYKFKEGLVIKDDTSTEKE